MSCCICGDKKFVQYGQLKCDWTKEFALIDKVKSSHFFCVRVETFLKMSESAKASIKIIALFTKFHFFS